MKRFLATLIATAFAVSGALLIANTRGHPETPEVGYQNLMVTLPNRSTPVSVHLWYPTKSGSPITRVGENALFWGFDAAVDAPAVEKPLPVVLFSHGSGGKARRHTWIATRLAFLLSHPIIRVRRQATVIPPQLCSLNVARMTFLRL
jgi:predicted dienelactone hydrolase